MERKVKIPYKKLIESIPNFDSIVKKQLPVKASFYLSKNIRTINKELEIFNEERQKILDNHIKRDKNKNPIKKEGNFVIMDNKKYNKDLEELLSIESEMILNIIPINNFFGNNISFSVQELESIAFMIEE